MQPSQVSSHLNAAWSPQNRWSGRADVKWLNEIDGTINMQTMGPDPWQLELSHKGHTWKDFRTKAGFRMNGDR
jgi:hypothetical protein